MNDVWSLEITLSGTSPVIGDAMSSRILWRVLNDKS